MPVMDVAQAREELIDLVGLVQDGEKVLIIGDDRNAVLMREVQEYPGDVVSAVGSWYGR